jgi:hypothetical protein
VFREQCSDPQRRRTASHPKECLHPTPLPFARYLGRVERPWTTARYTNSVARRRSCGTTSLPHPLGPRQLRGHKSGDLAPVQPPNPNQSVRKSTVCRPRSSGTDRDRPHEGLARRSVASASTHIHTRVRRKCGECCADVAHLKRVRENDHGQRLSIWD